MHGLCLFVCVLMKLKYLKTREKQASIFLLIFIFCLPESHFSLAEVQYLHL